MAGKNIAVSGIYRTGDLAERAAAQLKESGFESESISAPRASDSGFLVTVHCNSSVSVTRAENLLRQTGALDVASGLAGQQAAG